MDDKGCGGWEKKPNRYDSDEEERPRTTREEKKGYPGVMKEAGALLKVEAEVSMKVKIFNIQPIFY